MRGSDRFDLVFPFHRVSHNSRTETRYEWIAQPVIGSAVRLRSRSGDQRSVPGNLRSSPCRPLDLRRDDRPSASVVMSDLRLPEDFDRRSLGVVIVDHGSRRDDSNRRHESFVAAWRIERGYPIVEPAHMELAEPSIGVAFDACVIAGATTVVIAPFFLWPGNHWDRDIPALAAEAALRHPDVRYLVTAPLGPHPLFMDIVEDRIRHCLDHALGGAPECELCAGSGRCRLS